jgi:hypothetical protein
MLRQHPMQQCMPSNPLQLELNGAHKAQGRRVAVHVLCDSSTAAVTFNPAVAVEEAAMAAQQLSEHVAAVQENRATCS